MMIVFDVCVSPFKPEQFPLNFCVKISKYTKKKSQKILYGYVILSDLTSEALIKKKDGLIIYSMQRDGFNYKKEKISCFSPNLHFQMKKKVIK